VISASAVPGEKKGVAVPLELSEAEAGGIVRAFGEAAGGPPGPDLTGAKSTVPTVFSSSSFSPRLPTGGPIVTADRRRRG